MAFYKAAFGAAIRWHLDHTIAGLSIDGAEFFLAPESPQYGLAAPPPLALPLYVSSFSSTIRSPSTVRLLPPEPPTTAR
jgi:hypothetical protein